MAQFCVCYNLSTALWRRLPLYLPQCGDFVGTPACLGTPAAVPTALWGLFWTALWGHFWTVLGAQKKHWGSNIDMWHFCTKMYTGYFCTSENVFWAWTILLQFPHSSSSFNIFSNTLKIISKYIEIDTLREYWLIWLERFRAMAHVVWSL